MKYYSLEERTYVEAIILGYIKDSEELPWLYEKYEMGNIMKELAKFGLDNANYFKVAVHRKVFKIFLKMAEKNIAISSATFINYVQYELKIPFEDKRNLLEFFIKLSISKSESLLNFEYFCRLFQQHLIMDYWIHIVTMFRKNSFKSDDIIENSFGIVEGFTELWQKISNNAERQDLNSVADELKQKVENLRNGVATSVKVGLDQWDEFTGGFENTELYLLAGRPSMGKTTVAIALMKRAIAKGKIVYFFTLEMTKKQIINRFVADDLKISYKKIKRGYLSDEELEAVLQRYKYYEEHPYIIVDDLPSGSLSEFHEKVKARKCDMIVVDYLQLFNLDGAIKKQAGNREQEVGEISKSLKKIAKEINVPVLALSQLSRAVELRLDKRPQMSDLRESGSLEQDADVIIFVYRDAYYQIQRGHTVSIEQQGNVELIIAKGREIGLEKFEMWLDLVNSTIQENFK